MSPLTLTAKHSLAGESRTCLQFTSEQLEFFQSLSFDRNPLHCDPTYAHRTPMGEVVVFGMASVISCLGIWAKERAFRLRDIKGTFSKPLLVGKRYFLNMEETGDRVRIRVVRGNQAQAALSFSWERGIVSARPIPLVPFKPLAHPVEGVVNSKLTLYAYLPEMSLLDRLKEYLFLSVDQLPFVQLCSLLWASYFTGMEQPGRQALFSDFHFQYNSTDEPVFQLDEVDVKHDTRVNRTSVFGRGSRIGLFEVNSFVRPPPVKVSLSRIRHRIADKAQLSGKTALVTGASRGIGAALAGACGLSGAALVLNFRKLSEEADALCCDLDALKISHFNAVGDVSKDADCEQIRLLLESKGIRLDLLFLNASPPILPLKFLEQSSSDFSSFVQTSIDICVNPLYHLMPIMRENAQIVLISTSYLKDPKSGFSHYLTAKSAEEGLMLSLSEEFANLRFVSVRMPVTITDQTNVAIQNPNVASADENACKVISALMNCQASGYSLIEL